MTQGVIQLYENKFVFYKKNNNLNLTEKKNQV